MKKFVSFVLVLALALSLCTVAMAKNVADETKGPASESVTGYYLVGVNDTTSAGELTSHATAGWTKYTVDDESHTFYIPESYSDGTNTYYVCDEDGAENRVFDKNDKFVCFVYKTTITNPLPEGKVIAEGKENECDAYTADVIQYYEYLSATQTFKKHTELKYDGKTSSTKLTGVYIDGVLTFTMNGTVAKYPHNFKAADATYKATTNKDNQKLVAVKCKECGKTFEVVSSLGKYDGDFLKMTITTGTAAFATGDNAAATGTFNTGDSVYYVLLGNAATAGTSTTVDSSKTFDAGVAMYVGLSLMSVAGSAVVIGKKKEF